MAPLSSVATRPDMALRWPVSALRRTRLRLADEDAAPGPAPGNTPWSKISLENAGAAFGRPVPHPDAD